MAFLTTKELSQDVLLLIRKCKPIRMAVTHGGQTLVVTYEDAANQKYHDLTIEIAGVKEILELGFGARSLFP